jgi:plastocyanin
MPGTRPVLASLLVSLGLVVAGCGGGQSAGGGYGTPTPATTAPAATAGGASLDGTVGPGFEIQLTRNGQPVTTLAAGTYTLNVDDKSAGHDFHLTGPGVDVSTDVSFTGTKTFTITLAAGTYHYQCDPHASSMNGDFTVSG